MRWCSASAPTPPSTASSSTTATTPSAPRCPTCWRPSSPTRATFFEAFGWTVAWHDTLEADDLLGTYARLEAEAGGRVLVMTGDRDMFQCATDQVTVLYVRTGGRGAEPVGPAEVRKRYGVKPEQVPDFIALRGDPSDGIPGARGIGEKTAAELLKRHGSLEAALDGAMREIEAERPHGAARPARRAAALQGHRDASRRRREAARRIAPPTSRAAAAARASAASTGWPSRLEELAS